MKQFYIIILSLITLSACKEKANINKSPISSQKSIDIKKNFISPESIVIKKDLLYDLYTLADEYPYKKTIREFQWKKIRERLMYTDSISQFPTEWGVLQNYKNMKGAAPLTDEYYKNDYKNITDTFGTERYQNIPIYKLDNKNTPFRYALDGSFVRVVKEPTDSLKFALIETTSFKGTWWVPSQYLKIIPTPITFKKVIMVDKSNQNISTLEKSDSANVWLIRSMNPTTTGLHKPPHQKETPNGLFLIQERRRKMFYLKDGTKNIAGYAPYASRFSGGGYLHGVPINYPRNKEIEFSYSLGTTPRSHMCVRNATSHAKFIYEWGEINNTLVFVYE